MARSMNGFKLTGLLAGAVCLFAFAGGADASDRRFTFSYEALTQPKGSVEYEQWVTWKTTKRSAGWYAMAATPFSRWPRRRCRGRCSPASLR